MSLVPEEPLFLLDARDGFVFERTGALLGDRERLKRLRSVRGVACGDIAGLSVASARVPRLVEETYRGPAVRVRTAYGRSLTVTGDRLLFVHSHGRLVSRRAVDLQVGDLVALGRRLPRPDEPCTEIDLVRLLWERGHADAVRVEGEPIRRLLALKAARRQPAMLRRDEERVRLPREAWKRLARARRARGITGTDMAQRIGYRQACSISEFETCRSLPPAKAFRAYLGALGEQWPPEAVIVASQVDRWAAVDSANARYRAISPATWLASLDASDLRWLDRQPDKRDLVLYTRAHREGAVPRFRAVTTELCYALGWYLAEGSVSSRGARLNYSLGVDDDRYLPGLRAAIAAFGEGTAALHMPKGRPKSRHLYVQAPIAVRMIKALGLGGTALAKRIPDLIFKCPEECQQAFLEGYYLGDGTKQTEGRRLEFGTSSPDLAVGLLHLLAQFGVVASLFRRPGGVFTIRGEAVHTQPSFAVVITSVQGLQKLSWLWRQAPSAAAYDRRISDPVRPGHDEWVSDTVMSVPVREVEVFDYEGPVYDVPVGDGYAVIAGTGGFLSRSSGRRDARSGRRVLRLGGVRG
ncbi:LAGLIDADG family homing endonuclease [Actinomadura rupiterrae]|uniref:LAGLIDADG family homing endonuclease n=1 Tax=Actinomadura rupiterrae TaxID=559627 RepID=UPI0020A418D5|nr:LAGLIDADG family homing endonuclease [Actinomadura rupiterrae]MCP2335625.1 intein/homing endonuclease [Actinomadura rupiterrae]